jgi:N-acyl-L-homoserine lactone synthetase
MNVAQETVKQARPVERGVDLLDRVDYRLAETAEEKEEIYRLRYRAYLKEGAIDPNPEGRVTDRYDDMPNSWIFGVYYEGALASSLRISVSSPEFPTTPSRSVFPEMMEPAIAEGKIIVDPSRFVADPTPAHRFPELPYMTLRLAFVACDYFRADLGLASVRAEHQSFYRRIFMHSIAPPRDYPGLIKQIGLLAIEFPAMREQVFARYPFLRSSFFERRKLFERTTDRTGGKADVPVLALERPSLVPRA